MKHKLPDSFISQRVKVALVGCGGNGSQMLTGLARMDLALRAFGHPGLQVTAYDPDRVSESNIGRQLFSPSDVGHPKAVLLIHRLNVFFGLDWKAVPTVFPIPGEDPGRNHGEPDLVIGCVDSRKSRRGIAAWGKRFGHDPHRASDRHYWLDVGNLSNTGQVILGEFTPAALDKQTRHKLKHPPGTLAESFGHQPTATESRNALAAWRRELLPIHLPNVTDLFPDILDPSVPEEDLPSCSLAEALETQDLFVNQAVTTFALQLLWMFFRQGGLDHHGYFVNLASGSVSRLPICKETWRRFNPALCGDRPKSLDSSGTKTKNASRVKRKAVHAH